MNYDEYRLAKEYAAEEFDPTDERYWIAVGAYLKGVETGLKGLRKTVDGDRITRIVFFFSKETMRFDLKHPIMVANRFSFLHQLRKITGIKNVAIYE